MLNGLYSAQDRPAHSFSSRGMCADRAAAAAGGLDHQPYFILGEGRCGLIVHSPSIIGVNFDPVGSVSDLIAYDVNDIVAVRLLSALRYIPLGRESFRTVTSAGHN